ncbi:hypothetical protein NECAME_05257 [Necator americanus]|uniref:ATP-dependent DNA helicase n=1 Tax=Necator americanus TaxID=51031 RepID=W2SKZ1_NECAM|nr:hypothetical protein NECAME_05257 [Necator americanus]ETN69402.1 hypothetical protein NECAME_05257 [Necator americanus]
MGDGHRTSLMEGQQKETRHLMVTETIIWDEISMTPKRALEAVDGLLSDIMQNDRHFGGKLLIIEGDFRQELPIVAARQLCEFVRDKFCSVSNSLAPS